MPRPGEIIAHTVQSVVLPELVEVISAIPAVEAIYLYGSRARGDSYSRSDIDLAIVCPRATIRDWARIAMYAEDAPTLLDVTVVRLDTIEPSTLFYRNIQEDKVVLYEKVTG